MGAISLRLNPRYEGTALGRLYRRVMDCDMRQYERKGTLERDLGWLRDFLGFSKNV